MPTEKQVVVFDSSYLEKVREYVRTFQELERTQQALAEMTKRAEEAEREIAELTERLTNGKN